MLPPRAPLLLRIPTPGSSLETLSSSKHLAQVRQERGAPLDILKIVLWSHFSLPPSCQL